VKIDLRRRVTSFRADRYNTGQDITITGITLVWRWCRSVKEIERLKEFSFEMGPIRPPSEGGSFSLLIRVTRNCP